MRRRSNPTGRSGLPLVRLRREAVVVALAVVAFGCGSSEPDPDDGPSLSPEEAEQVETSTSPPDDTMQAPDVETQIELLPDDPGSGQVRVHRPADVTAVAACGDEPAGSRPVVRFPTTTTADAGAGPVTVEVVGCRMDGIVGWEAFHGEDRRPTLEGQIAANGDEEVFSIVETYWTPGEWTVVVFGLDAQSGERLEEDAVSFTVG